MNFGEDGYYGLGFTEEAGPWDDRHSMGNYSPSEPFPTETVYIPVKEMLANAPGFRSLYARREIHFEEIYTDILDHAYLPPLRNPENKHLLGKLQASIGGEVVIKGEEFFLQTEQGLLEFTLLAEGFRKLGLALAADTKRLAAKGFCAVLG